MRITESEAKQRWDEAIGARGWQKRTIERVMFDHQGGEPTRYYPAPAWPTIADANNTADLEDYTHTEQSLISQGERYSERGAARSGGGSDVVFTPNPQPLRREQIVDTVEQVMSNVHPLAVTQEQILRAAFFAYLPIEVSKAIGTAEAAVHPERPTPSSNYILKGKRNVGMCARYDLGFGHPSASEGIVGVMELKSGSRSFDSLRNVSGWEEGESEALELTGQCDKRNEPLHVDLYKMLDSQLPDSAFRISWIALGRRGRSTAADIRNWAERIVKRAATQRNRSGATFHVDSASGWLVCTWPQVKLELAWYRPAADNSTKFEPIFAT